MPQQQPYAENQSQSARVAIRNQGILTVGRVGAVNTAVLLFQSLATTPGIGFLQGVDWIEQVNDADLGTEVRIRAPGQYTIELGLSVVGQDPPLNPTAGVSVDVEASGLVSVPDFAIDGMLDVWPTNLPLGESFGLKITTSIEVTQEEARQVVGGTQGRVVRFHAAADDGGNPIAPGASIAQEPAWFQIRRTGDSYVG